MGPVILHIWGPFAIQAYGFFIALGALAFLFFIQRDARFTQLKLEDRFNTIFLWGAAAVLIGGRVLHIWREYESYDSWVEWFAFWEPGYAVLGSTLAVVTTVPAYLYYHKIPALPFLDLVATYAPLLESIGRIGCFFAGCCFGCATMVPWAVYYTDPLSLAPTEVFLHPSQLYSSLGSFLIFLFMYLYARSRFVIAGQQTALFLMLAALERFIVDFWRGDRELLFQKSFIALSFHQFLAIGIIVIAGVAYFWLARRRKQSKV